MSYSNKEEYNACVEAFKAKYPDFAEAKDIEILNLVMTKKNAKEILSGEKKVEYRAMSEHYINRLFDKNVSQFLAKHQNEDGSYPPDVQDVINDGIVDSLRIVKTIHFHNYANSWFMDVEVEVNDTCALIPKDMEFLHDRYDSHDLDDAFNTLEAQNSDERPIFFFFAIKRIIKTNLE